MQEKQKTFKYAPIARTFAHESLFRTERSAPLVELLHG